MGGVQLMAIGGQVKETIMAADFDRVQSALFSLDPGMPRDDWFKVCAAVKAGLGEDGLTLFDSWSQGDEKSYDPGAVRTIWRSTNEVGGITVKTLYFMARRIGWRYNGTYQKPSAEEVAERQRRSAERNAKEEARKARLQAEAARKASQIWNAAVPATADNPYLVRKRVLPTSSFREINAKAVKEILGYTVTCREEPLVGRLLVAPIEIDGKLPSNLEFIDEAGRKPVISGSRKTDGFCTVRPLDDVAKTLVIAEGVATALSAGYPAVAALTSSNLKSVALQMCERHPAADLVVSADLIKDTGEPDPHAVDAARAVAGRLAIPDFGDGRDPSWTDLNDLLVHRGSDAVAACIASAKVPALGIETEHRETLDAGDEASPGAIDGLPIIQYDPGALPRNLDEAGSALLAMGGVYQRGSLLVRVVKIPEPRVTLSVRRHAGAHAHKARIAELEAKVKELYARFPSMWKHEDLVIGKITSDGAALITFRHAPGEVPVHHPRDAGERLVDWLLRQEGKEAKAA
jgi:putative DNA primase/helicase